jgi:GNAT superfamily N-acetyltransferase
MQTEVRRLDASRVDDFYRLHSDEHEAGWCFCAAWWVPSWDGWGERSAEDNRHVRDGLCERGEYDGYLLYLNDVPVGWCQVGPRDRLWKLRQRFRLHHDPETWAISCFLIAPAHRRRGLAAVMLRDVLDDLRKRGVRRVEAFPPRGTNLDPGDLWTGPEALYRGAGFEIVRDDPRCPVYGITLDQASGDG